MVSPVRPVQRHDERPETHRTSTCDFFWQSWRYQSVRTQWGIHFRVPPETRSAHSGTLMFNIPGISGRCFTSNFKRRPTFSLLNVAEGIVGIALDFSKPSTKN
jgi:hypothetical protein